MKKIIFKGAGVAIVTPFNEKGINFPELGRLIDFNIENGTDAIIICGTTGEAATMDDREHKEAISFAVEHTNKRIPVIAGAGSNDTSYSVELAKFSKKAGADGLLMVTPYYNKTTQRGLVKHFFHIAEATDLPMIVYNVPSRTGLNIAPKTYLELSKHPNIVATKEANSNISEIAMTRHLCGDELHMYSGNDDQIVPILSLGGIGVISVLSNVIPKTASDICKLYFEGKVKESAKLQLDVMELCSALFCETNPIPVKTALRLMGYDVGHLRMPLCEMEGANLELLKTALKNAGLIK